MIDLSPKKRFQEEHPETATQFRTMVVGSQFHEALTAAFTEWIWKSAPSSERIYGARDFIQTFLNIAEPEEPLPAYPVRRLTTLHAAPAKEQPQPQPK